MGTKNSSRFTPLIIAISVVAGILIGTFYAKHFAGNRLGIINGSSNKLNALLRVVDDQYVDSVNRYWQNLTHTPLIFPHRNWKQSILNWKAASAVSVSSLPYKKIPYT